MPRLSKEFSVWFDYPDDPHGGKVEIRHIPPEELARIESEVNTTRLVAGPGKMPEKETRTDTILDRKLTTDAAVKDWENFLDEEDKPMECSSENKHLWSCDMSFWLFVLEKRKEVAKLLKEREEELLKN